MNEVSRRAALGAGLLAGIGGLPIAAVASVRNGKGKSLPSDPAAQNRALVKLLGDTAGGRVTWKTRGVIYAIQPDKVTPLNGKTVKLPASFIRHKEGEVLTPNGRWFPAMKLAFPQQYAEAPLSLHWDLAGDTVRIHEPSNFPPILPQPSLEVATLFSSASELFARRTTRARGEVAGWNVFSWHPYLDMGATPGHILWHFDAVKVASAAALDPDYLHRARQFTPLFDQSPELDEGPTFFERILQRRRGSAS